MVLHPSKTEELHVKNLALQVDRVNRVRSPSRTLPSSSVYNSRTPRGSILVQVAYNTLLVGDAEEPKKRSPNDDDEAVPSPAMTDARLSM